MSKKQAFDLNGHCALITGAGRGLGESCAKTLAQAGSEVVLVARSQDQLEKVKESIIDEGGRATVHVSDLTQMKAIQNLENLGAFSILVNNAGMNRPETFSEVSEKNFNEVFELNVKSAFFVAQIVVKGMIREGKGGSVINMSSQMGHVGGQNRTVYCATKHAMEGFSKAMSLDLAHHKIRVNTVCPTFIETEMTRPLLANHEFMNDIINRIPLGHVGLPEDVAGAVLYLASDASRMVTGSSIKVDGGWTAV